MSSLLHLVLLSSPNRGAQQSMLLLIRVLASSFMLTGDTLVVISCSVNSWHHWFELWFPDIIMPLILPFSSLLVVASYHISCSLLNLSYALPPPFFIYTAPCLHHPPSVWPINMLICYAIIHHSPFWPHVYAIIYAVFGLVFTCTSLWLHIHTVIHILCCPFLLLPMILLSVCFPLPIFLCFDSCSFGLACLGSCCIYDTYYDYTMVHSLWFMPVACFACDLVFYH